MLSSKLVFHKNKYTYWETEQNVKKLRNDDETHADLDVQMTATIIYVPGHFFSSSRLTLQGARQQFINLYTFA